MKENRRIRLVMTNKAYKKKGNDFIIPIFNENGRFITGQPEVSFQEATGEIPVEQSKVNKYGYIINPLEIYRVKNMRWFDMDNDYDKALIELLRLSRKISLSKAEYDKDKQKFDGYLEDVQKEAEIRNKVRTEKILAESEVVKASHETLTRAALILNFKLKGFSCNPSKVSFSVLQDSIFAACEENPVLVKNCFEKYNSNINHDAFGVELVHFNILKRDRQGAIYDGTTYVAQTIDRLREYVADKTNSSIIGKWGSLLKEAKNGIGIDISSVESIKPENLFNKQKVDVISQVKVALFNEDIRLAETIVQESKAIATANDIDEMNEIISTYKRKQEKGKEVDPETGLEIKKEFIDMTVEELQAFIGRNKFKGWKISEVSDKEDQMHLIKYIEKKSKQ